MKNKTSKWTLLERGFNMGLSNIWRNKALSIATILVISIILFIFNVIISINFITQDSLAALNQKIDITVYLQESTSFTDAKNMINELNQLPGITKAEYISKEKALADLKSNRPDLTLTLEQYNLQNSLPASINVKTDHPQYYATVENFFNQEPYKKHLANLVSNNANDSSILNSVAQNFLKLDNFAKQLVFWLVITFIIGGTLIILNALQITIFHRKKEIGVMKLVGSSYWFIRLPFIIESIIYGILAVILSFAILLIISNSIQIQEISFWNLYSSLNFALIFLVELGITIILSIASSIIAVHEYLQQDESI